MYLVNTTEYKGPLEKLLELVEDKKMEVTQVSLALVTDDFLKYLQSIKRPMPARRSISEGGRTSEFRELNEHSHSNSPVGEEESQLITHRSEEEVRLLADFLVIASRLLLIKSKSLLPNLELTQEEEVDIMDLEKRLKFYQEFKLAINHVKNLYDEKNQMASRPLFLGRQVIFYPAPNINLNSLHSAMKNIFETMKQLNLEFQTLEISLIRLEEKIEEIIGKVQEGIQNFGHLIKEKSRKEIVVMFLALLHLLREQTVEVEQKEGFSEIVIKKTS